MTNLVASADLSNGGWFSMGGARLYAMPEKQLEAVLGELRRSDDLRRQLADLHGELVAAGIAKPLVASAATKPGGEMEGADLLKAYPGRFSIYYRQAWSEDRGDGQPIKPPELVELELQQLLASAGHGSSALVASAREAWEASPEHLVASARASKGRMRRARAPWTKQQEAASKPKPAKQPARVTALLASLRPGVKNAKPAKPLTEDQLREKALAEFFAAASELSE